MRDFQEKITTVLLNFVDFLVIFSKIYKDSAKADCCIIFAALQQTAFGFPSHRYFIQERNIYNESCYF